MEKINGPSKDREHIRDVLFDVHVSLARRLVVL